MSTFDAIYRRYSLVEDSLAASPWRAAFIAAIHLAALAILYQTEWGLIHGVLAVLAWALLNCGWLFVLRRPGLSAALSLAMLSLIVVLSQFKFGILWMGLTFLDFLIVDPDSLSYLFGIFPQLRLVIPAVAVVAILSMVVIWHIDALRVPRLVSALGIAEALIGLAALSFAVPEQPWEPFQGANHVSNFARSGVTQLAELVNHGWLDSGARITDEPPLAAAGICTPTVKPPHIIMLLDESSFDVTAAPGIIVPTDYKQHFRSFDGKARNFVMEATGGPTWYAEYNVLTGLSARSFGRFMFYVTRLAAGRVERGLPQALRRCGYNTITLYPTAGEFLSARRFQTTTGISHFLDQADLGAPDDMQPDSYYFDQAVRAITREKSDGPLFLFVYVTANHFPWNWVYKPELTPDWRGLGNAPPVDEYVRRQMMSAHDYDEFRARLKRDFPGESFLLARFGDHQPAISSKILEPSLDDAQIGRHIRAYDPTYFTTYYAIDTVNFEPVDLSSAMDTLEAPYLPIVIQEAAGIPLDPTFAEQKKIMQRCNGAFYACDGGAEARRFNRLLIDAHLIRGF
jgi:Sulfatase